MIYTINKKASHSKNDLPNGGGEVRASLNILITQSLQNARFRLIVSHRKAL